MRQSRDRNGLTIHTDDCVSVQVGDGPRTTGKIRSTTPHNPALAGCALVEFDNGTSQWMGGEHLEVARQPEARPLDS